MVSACPEGMEYQSCGWSLSCSHVTLLSNCEEMPSCTSGCFCTGQMVLYNGVCSNATLCSGTYEQLCM